MISTLISRSSSPGSRPGQGHCYVLGRGMKFEEDFKEDFEAV